MKNLFAPPQRLLVRFQTEEKQSFDPHRGIITNPMLDPTALIVSTSVPSAYRQGDRVFFLPMNDKVFYFEGEKYYSIHEDDVLAVIKKTND